MKGTPIINSFTGDNSGAAAVEMVLVAPVIAGLAFASVSLWDATMRRQQQDEALRVASQYYLNGGSDDSKARLLGLSAWPEKPQDAQITISRLYRCGAASANGASLCSGTQTPPATFVKIVAQATTAGATFQAEMIRQEMVRVR